jgi:glucosamine kinase
MELAQHVHVDTDVRVAFQDAFGDGPGILLLAGTGSIAWGRAEDGREGRVGGLGHHIGDEGSGYQIGVEAVRRVARHDDGRGPATSLREVLLGFLGLERVDDLVTWSSYATRAEIAELAPLVVQAADDRDAVAEEMVNTAVTELESNVLTILETLGPWSERPGLVLGGGLLRENRPLRSRLVGLFENRHVQLLDRDPDPPMGAAQLALASVRWGP